MAAQNPSARGRRKREAQRLRGRSRGGREPVAQQPHHLGHEVGDRLAAFRLGAWALPVNVLALVYGVSAIMAVGLVYLVLFKPYDRGHVPAGDAHILGAESVAYADKKSGWGC